MYRRQKPKEVMVINRYNRQEWAPEGTDPDILEKTLGTWIEPDAQKIFDKLTTRPADITDDESPILLLYLELQRLRVSRQAQMAKELLKSGIAHLFPETVGEIRRCGMKIIIKESFRFEMMRP